MTTTTSSSSISSLGHPCPEIFVLSNGEKVRANNPRELVEYLRAGSFDNDGQSYLSLEQYMFHMSERCLLSLQAIVRIDTPEHFVQDLMKCGIINGRFKAS